MNASGLQVTLWALGAALSVIGAIGLFILQGIARRLGVLTEGQGKHGEALARLETSALSANTSIANGADEVRRLDEKVDKLTVELARVGGTHELVKAFVDALNATPRRARKA